MVEKKPNFIVIVADDLGFTDLSPFGGEIDTPNLNKLAFNGLRFTDFHTASACSPTRSMLLSGTDNHIAGLGQMIEYSRNFPELFEGKPGYEGYLNYRVAALSEILQDNGYYNFISGKWHLGLTPEFWPSKRGFEKLYTLLPGSGNHYKYFPVDESTGDYTQFMKPIYQQDGQTLDPQDLPKDFYSTDDYTTKFIEFLTDEDTRNHRPFFGFLTYTAPHWPYQAHDLVIEKYKGRYDAGPAKLRIERLTRAIELGIIPQGIQPHKVESLREKIWEELSEVERQTEARIMEVYAAMVDILDQNVGRVVKSLEDSGELDNTFILFMSDNGAEGMLLEALPLWNDNVENNIKKYYDNSLENIGKPNSFVWYSDQWAQAATAPWYMYKMWASEGGIRCPLIVHYPDQIKDAQQVKNQFVTVMDILPTILDFAEVSHPGTKFQGRDVVVPRGKSWKNYLVGEAEYVHDEETVTGWELFAQQAIRKGRYKALYIPKPIGPDRWQLFDLLKDPGETNDLAEIENEKLKELVDHWAEYVAETGLVDCTQEFYTGLKAVYEPQQIEDWKS